MAGQRLSRASSRARNVVENLISQGEKLSDPNLAQAISIGPHNVELAFASSGALRDLIVGAFVHPVNFSNSSVTRVYVCFQSDSVDLPNFDWALEWIMQNQVIPSALTSPHRLFIDKNQGIIYCFDPINKKALIYIRNTRHLDLRSFITPFRLMWSWIATMSSSLILHAAAIEVNGFGVLLCGPSGSGKSTLALSASSRRGHPIISDDCVLVHQEKIYAIYSRAKLKPETVKEMGFKGDVEIHSLPVNYAAKNFVQIPQAFPNYKTKSKVSLIVFPAIYGRGGSFELDVSRARLMLTSDSMREVFSGTPLARRGIRDLVASIPTHRLLLGDSINENITNLEEIVSHVHS